MTARRTLTARVQYEVARRLAAMPTSWQLRLAGREPVIRDGLTLDPSLQVLLEMRRRRGITPLPGLSPAAARRRARRESAAAAGPPVPVAAVRDLTIDGADGPLPARHYAPAQDGADRQYAPDEGGDRPLLVFYHGGGFVLGDLETHDQACRMLCRHAGVHVLSVDYRLAPEHPFPAAVEDAWAALRWAFAHARELGANPASVAVGGDSAGGNLAAVVSQIAAAEGGPAPVLQLLLYPALDRSTPYPSLDLFADSFFLTRDEIDWFEQHYSGGAERVDPRLSPMRRDGLGRLAPAFVVTAGFDPLRDEGEAYAATMADAGTAVRLRRESGMIHGFINMVDLSRTARAVLVEIAEELREMLDCFSPAPDPEESAARTGKDGL